MAWFTRDNGPGLHWREDGDPSGAPVLFLNSLGTDLRLWDASVANFPQTYRLIRMDTRGHGLSDVPPGAYSLDALADDVIALLDHLELPRVVLVGVSLGGMMTQYLAMHEPDRVRAAVLSNTAPRMGTPELWQMRINTSQAQGVAPLVDGVMERWFAAPFRDSPEVNLWRNMLQATPAIGYAGCCAALATADLRAQVGQIYQPALVISGADDHASPPTQVQMLADSLGQARYVQMSGVGHLPMAERPVRFAQIVAGFLEELEDEPAV